ncbi:MAG: universal stress protein, partial [Bacteroidota bacterium]
MQCILIPVDFSIPCYNAYCYGLQLASATGRNVVLTHYRSESLIPSEYLQTNGGSDFPDSFLLRLKQFAYPAGHSPEIPLVDIPDNVSISYECRSVLSPANAIINRALEDDIDIVVMATRSSRAPLKDWLGSTS